MIDLTWGHIVSSLSTYRRAKATGTVVTGVPAVVLAAGDATGRLLIRVVLLALLVLAAVVIAVVAFLLVAWLVVKLVRALNGGVGGLDSRNTSVIRSASLFK